MKFTQSVVSLIIMLILNAALAEERDPTRPLGYDLNAISAQEAEISSNELHLSGILLIPHRFTAVINNTYLKEGDYINGYRVKTISLNYVVVANANKEITLYLFETVKKPSGTTQ